MAASVAASWGSARSRACTRTSSWARCSPNIWAWRRIRASLVSAMRVPRWARRLASIRSRSPRNCGGVGVARLVAPDQLVVEPAVDGGQLAAVRLIPVALADLARDPRQLALVALDRLQQLRRCARQPRRHPQRAGEVARLLAKRLQRQLPRSAERHLPGARPARRGCRRGRPQPSCRSAAAAAPPGTRAPRPRPRRRRRPAGWSRRTTECAGSRRPPTAASSAPRRSATGARCRRRCDRGRGRGRRRCSHGSSSRASWSARRTWAPSTVRRAASVGWAVNTSSTEICSASSPIAPSSSPRARSVATASESVSRGRLVRRRRRSRWCCSARFIELEVEGEGAQRQVACRGHRARHRRSQLDVVSPPAVFAPAARQVAQPLDRQPPPDSPSCSSSTRATRSSNSVRSRARSGSMAAREGAGGVGLRHPTRLDDRVSLRLSSGVAL